MSERHHRVESLLKEVVATFIQQEANTDPLITVTRAETSPDFRRVTIFFTTIPDGREEIALAFLQRSGSAIRGVIKKKCHLKIIPFVDFSVDYGERHRQHMDTIANTIESNKAEK